MHIERPLHQRGRATENAQFVLSSTEFVEPRVFSLHGTGKDSIPSSTS